MNTLTLEYPESLPDSARLSRREFEKSMRFAMAAKLFELGRISSLLKQLTTVQINTIKFK